MERPGPASGRDRDDFPGSTGICQTSRTKRRPAQARNAATLEADVDTIPNGFGADHRMILLLSAY